MKTSRSGWILFLALAWAVMPLGTDAKTTTATSNGNWTDAIWDNGVPIATDHVAIGAGVTVTLTNSTPELGSFTNSGALVFNGDSGFGTNIALSATSCTILSGGSVTHATNTTATTNALGVWVPSNRVWIVCTDFLLATNASINANGRGYIGTVTPGRGPGKGLNSSARGGGGGYGGRGGDCNAGAGLITNSGSAYGSTNAPVDPGSSGGYSQGGAGNGGGAVFVQASGTVTIFGTISADGTIAPNQYDGGGSGGSIYLTCNAFAGSTNGLLSAKGGNAGIGGTPSQPGGNGSGGGGGGRIAVIYGAGQSANPGVRFDTSAGSGYYPSDSGTVYFPHGGILDPNVSAGRLDGWLFKNVRLFIPGFTNWISSSLTVSNCIVTFAQPGFTLLTIPEITIATNGSLTVESGSGQLTCTDLFLTNSAALTLGTNWTVTCTNLSIRSSGRLTLGAQTTLRISGTQSIGSGASLTLGAQSTLYMPAQDLIMDGGSITVGSNSTIPGLTGNVIVKNGGSADLGLQTTALNANQIAVTNGGNLSLYAASLNCTSLEARGTGTTNTGNIKLYYLPTVDANSMLVTNGGSVAIWAPATNLPGTNYATLVTVQGNLTIGSNSWVYPWAGNRSTDTARTIYMRAANIAIAAGGGIDADGKGYARAWGPGKGANGPGSSRSGGGGHGGAGAASDYGVAGGITNDNALMPIDAGSGGGNQGLVILNSDGVDIGGGEGGGAVRLEATGTVNLDGTITADGIASGPSLPTMAFGGGGAGGTIYVKCNKFAGAATGRMTAEGRSGAGNGDVHTGGGGGGGRIAVWRVVHTYAGQPSVSDWANSVTSVVTFAWSPPGGIGTVEWVDVPPPPPSGTVFILE